jgi:hypothetical protein
MVWIIIQVRVRVRVTYDISRIGLGDTLSVLSEESLGGGLGFVSGLVLVSLWLVLLSSLTNPNTNTNPNPNLGRRRD